jgi:GDPmannose 4,6-dehydratase
MDPRYLRPTEVDHLVADSSKAKRVIGWETRVDFGQLVRIMVDADMEIVGLSPPGEGRQVLKERFDEWHKWETEVIAMERQLS